MILKIYNLHGQEIKTLVDEIQTPNNYVVSWDGSDNNGNQVSSGVYLYQLKAGAFSQIKKMSLIR